MSWHFEVDWNDDGNWVDEGARLFDVQVRGNRNGYVRLDGGGLMGWDVGRLVVKLTNNDGRYDYMNSNSPLYANLRPGKRFVLKVDVGGGSEVIVMRGRITDITPVWPAGNATIKGESIWADMLRNYEHQVERNVAGDDVLRMILAEAGWWGDVDVGGSLQVLDMWTVQGMTAAAALQSVIDAELGAWAPRLDGTFWFRNRHYISDETKVLGDELRWDKTWRQPWKDVRDRVRVGVHELVDVASGTEVWQSSQAVAVPAGLARTIEVEMRSGNDMVWAEAVLVDYEANSAADGSGVDMTADVTATVEALAGHVARLKFTNNGGGDAYVVRVSLRVQVGAVNRLALMVAAGDGDDELVIDEPWIDDANVARDMAYFLLDRVSEGDAGGRVHLRNCPEVQFGIREGDKVELDVVTRYGVSLSGRYFRVRGVEHKSRDRNLMVFDTFLELEPLRELDEGLYWIFPVQFGVNTRLAW